MDDRPLYALLGVPMEATRDEIRRAYHRLALRLHPDRGGEEASLEQFQRVQGAYTLLSDPEARAIYDRYGDAGLNNMESMPAMREAGHQMSAASFFRITFAVTAMVSALLLVFFALLGCKFDGVISTSWYVVPFPMYILFLFFAAATFISIGFRIRKYRRAAAAKRQREREGSAAVGGGGATTTIGGSSQPSGPSSPRATPTPSNSTRGGGGGGGVTMRMAFGGGGAVSLNRHNHNNNSNMAASSMSSMSVTPLPQENSDGAESFSVPATPASPAPAGASGGDAADAPASPTTAGASPQFFFPTSKKAKRVRELRFWTGHTMALAIILTVFMVVISLAEIERNGHTRLGMWGVLSPALAGNVLSVFAVFIFRDGLHLYGVHCVTRRQVVALNVLAFLQAVLRVVIIVMIILKVEYIQDMLVIYVCTPLLIYYVVTAVFGAYLANLRMRGSEKLQRELPYMSPEEQEFLRKTHRHSPSMWVEILLYAFVNGMLFLGTLLAALVGSGRLDTSYRVAFAPFYVMCGFLFVMSCFLFVCFSIFIDTVDHEQREKDLQRRHEREEAEREGSAHGGVAAASADIPVDGGFRMGGDYNEGHDDASAGRGGRGFGVVDRGGGGITISIPPVDTEGDDHHYNGGRGPLTPAASQPLPRYNSRGSYPMHGGGGGSNSNTHFQHYNTNNSNTNNTVPNFGGSGNGMMGRASSGRGQHSGGGALNNPPSNSGSLQQRRASQSAAFGSPLGKSGGSVDFGSGGYHHYHSNNPHHVVTFSPRSPNLSGHHDAADGEKDVDDEQQHHRHNYDSTHPPTHQPLPLDGGTAAEKSDHSSHDGDVDEDYAEGHSKESSIHRQRQQRSNSHNHSHTGIAPPPALVTNAHRTMSRSSRSSSRHHYIASVVLENHNVNNNVVVSANNTPTTATSPQMPCDASAFCKALFSPRAVEVVEQSSVGGGAAVGTPTTTMGGGRSSSFIYQTSSNLLPPLSGGGGGLPHQPQTPLSPQPLGGKQAHYSHSHSHSHSHHHHHTHHNGGIVVGGGGADGGGTMRGVTILHSHSRDDIDHSCASSAFYPPSHPHHHSHHDDDGDHEHHQLGVIHAVAGAKGENTPAMTAAHAPAAAATTAVGKGQNFRFEYSDDDAGE